MMQWSEARMDISGKKVLWWGCCRLLLQWFAILCAASVSAHGAGVASLASDFAKPPDTARPHAYWYWMEGHITKEGLDADLEAMKRVGIGGVEIYTVAGHALLGPVVTWSPEWQGLLKHAIRRAGELGIEVDLNNSPRGWSSSNGPWITPEKSMQVLTFAETRVQGGQPFTGLLPQPKAVKGYYRDIAVLAFPTPEAEQHPLPKPHVTGSGEDFKGELLVDGNPTTGCPMPVPEAGAGGPPPVKPARNEKLFLQLSYDHPVKARSLNMLPLGGKVVRGGKLLASDDNSNWREVTKFRGAGSGVPVIVVFPSVTARYWQVVFDRVPKIAIAEVALDAGYRIPEWSGKAQYNLAGLDRPSFTSLGLEAPRECRIKQDSIIDLTAKLDASGRLDWTPPPGDWTILRLGHTNNGMEKSGWLECDKFDPAAVDLHWSNFEKPLFEDPVLNAAIQYVHVDSYEAGAQNWTRNFPMEFKQRCGYDLMRYLPVLIGRVVDDVPTSERVLWDFRQVCNQLITDNYFGHFQKLCHRAGKQFTLEGYNLDQFHCGTVASKGDVPMCEFWANGKSAPGVHLWFKSGASPAHLYGRPIVGAEAFTANGVNGGNYNSDPWSLKVLGDSAFCGGVNRYVYHVFVHQPWTNLAPGATLALYGSHFERGNTWFEQMRGFNTYVSRCQHLLQQGQFKADILYSYSENTPNNVATLNLATPKSPGSGPRGYDYDLCTPDDILNRMTVRDGQLVIPGGMVYRLLVLADDPYVTPALVRKVGDLVKAGAKVMAPKPQRSPSQANQPEADAEVARLAEEIWGEGKTTDRRVGKGRIVWGKPVGEVLASMGMVPDFDCGELAMPINMIHRQLEDGDLYFVANPASEEQATTCSFRVSGMKPELWDPVTGKIRALPEYREEGVQTVVPLKFESRQSYFVMFRKEGQGFRVQGSGKNFQNLVSLMSLSGPWTVQFDPRWGGPQKPVTFETLEDWTKRPEPGIKYYSGTATYRKVFDLDPEPRTLNPVYLDLGTVKNLAQVRLNGKDLGIVWCAPWRVEVTGLLREKGNELEIDVVNLWVNRMIGDEQLPDDCDWSGKPGIGFGVSLKKLPAWLQEKKPRTSGRYTFCFMKHWQKDDPLLPSGLLGPVRLMAE
jgi:hypothetical protein